MKDLFGNNTTPETKKQHQKRLRKELYNADGSCKYNPMVGWYGLLEGDHKCKECIYLCCSESSKKYYKCRWRKCSRSPSTDHRVNWPACGKFEPKNTNL